MKISLQILIDHEDGQSTMIKPVAEIRRGNLSIETLGLTLMLATKVATSKIFI